MRGVWILALLLAACGPKDAPGPELHPTRQQPSVTEPGLHISGHVNIGVKRRL